MTTTLDEYYAVDLPNEELLEFVGRFLLDNPQIEARLVSVEADNGGGISLSFEGLEVGVYNEVFFPSFNNEKIERYYNKEEVIPLLTNYFTQRGL
jgi:hypothetical protein